MGISHTTTSHSMSAEIHAISRIQATVIAIGVLIHPKTGMHTDQAVIRIVIIADEVLPILFQKEREAVQWGGVGGG